MAKEKKNGPVYLSKTLFLKGLQCHKALYLFKFHHELRDDLSGSQEAIFQSGTQLGIWPRDSFRAAGKSLMVDEGIIFPEKSSPGPGPGLEL